MKPFRGIELHSTSLEQHDAVVGQLVRGTPPCQIKTVEAFTEGNPLPDVADVIDWQEKRPDQPLPGTVISRIVLLSHLD